MKKRKQIKQYGKVIKVLKSQDSGSRKTGTKKILKKSEPLLKGLIGPEVTTHESITIPLNDPFHDV